MRRLLLFAVLISVACRDESGRSASDQTADLIRDVTTAARQKARVKLLVKALQEEPGPADLELRRSIEERIEQRRIGRVISSAAGAGFIEVEVEVENSAVAIPQLRQVAKEAGVLDRATFRVEAPKE